MNVYRNQFNGASYSGRFHETNAISACTVHCPGKRKTRIEDKEEKRKVVCRKTSFHESTVFFCFLLKICYFFMDNLMCWHRITAIGTSLYCNEWRRKMKIFDFVDTKEWKKILIAFSSRFGCDFVCSRVTSANAGEAQNLSFCKGLKLLETNCVENVLQVGESRFDYSRFHYIVVTCRSLWLIDST